MQYLIPQGIAYPWVEEICLYTDAQAHRTKQNIENLTH